MAEKHKFVIVFAIGGTLFNDFGWAPSAARFVRTIHYRLVHPKKYPKYTGLSRTTLFQYEVCDITAYAKRTPENNAAVKEIVAELKRIVGKKPVK